MAASSSSSSDAEAFPEVTGAVIVVAYFWDGPSSYILYDLHEEFDLYGRAQGSHNPAIEGFHALPRTQYPGPFKVWASHSSIFFLGDHGIRFWILDYESCVMRRGPMMLDNMVRPYVIGHHDGISYVISNDLRSHHFECYDAYHHRWSELMYPLVPADLPIMVDASAFRRRSIILSVLDYHTLIYHIDTGIWRRIQLGYRLPFEGVHLFRGNMFYGVNHTDPGFGISTFYLADGQMHISPLHGVTPDVAPRPLCSRYILIHPVHIFDMTTSGRICVVRTGYYQPMVLGVSYHDAIFTLFRPEGLEAVDVWGVIFYFLNEEHMLPMFLSGCFSFPWVREFGSDDGEVFNDGVDDDDGEIDRDSSPISKRPRTSGQFSLSAGVSETFSSYSFINKSNFSGNSLFAAASGSEEIETTSGMLVLRWVNAQLGRILSWVERAIQQELWEPISTHQRHGSSIVEVFRIVEETVDKFFALKVPTRLGDLNSLFRGIDSALQVYSKHIVDKLANKEDLIPPVPVLARYRRESGLKSFVKKELIETRLSSVRMSTEIDVPTTSMLCVQLNTLYHAITQLNKLEDSIWERWTKKKPQDKSAKRSVDEHPKSSMQKDTFDGSRKDINATINRICQFTGTKIVFWDLREPFLDNLYKPSVFQSRMEVLIEPLDVALKQICDVIIDPLRDRVVTGLLQAYLDGLLRVILDGGSSLIFSTADAKFLEEDVEVLKEFFISGGDGLARGVVENQVERVWLVVKLHETRELIDDLKSASGLEMQGAKSELGADTTLLRILCHRGDSEASQFLKKQFKIPKLVA